MKVFIRSCAHFNYWLIGLPLELLICKKTLHPRRINLRWHEFALGSRKEGTSAFKSKRCTCASYLQSNDMACDEEANPQGLDMVFVVSRLSSTEQYADF
jgi:hypothetical protein